MRGHHLLLLGIASACTATSPDDRPEAANARLERVSETKETLPAGTVIELLPSEAVRAGRVSLRQVDGLLRESLRQDLRYDIAAGVENCDSNYQLSIAIDPQAKVLTASLHRDGEAPLPLSSAVYLEAELPAAVDRLSLGILQALGSGMREPWEPCSLIYSNDSSCVEQTEAGFEALNRGDVLAAQESFQRARSKDSGCTISLLGLGTAQLRSGRSDDAVETARGALEHMGQRMSATTRHRLARLVLLGEVVSDPRRATENDSALLRLGEASLRERPNDPHGLYSKALALNYLRRFSESSAVLAGLRKRWPGIPLVAYHLSFAELATDKPEAALQAIESAERKLPSESVVLPKCLALYHAGHHEELEKYLARLARQRRGIDDRRPHELMRMQAAHAILMGDRESAAEFMLTDIDWLRQRPSILQSLALDFAESGEVLVHLGYHEELAVRLQALDEVRVHAPYFRQAQAYLAALVSIQALGELPSTAISTLEGEEQFVWSTLLKAALHRRQGELVEEATDLATAIRITDSALVRASLARTMDAMGRDEDANRLRSDLGQRLMVIDLRRPLNHPLLSPARALAYISINP
ncbi:MAG: hypothetical protein ACYTG5_11540 [Planctomycetota bacterium]|jgi:tetratricopeptide (TPR) repeat protein